MAKTVVPVWGACRLAKTEEEIGQVPDDDQRQAWPNETPKRHQYCAVDEVLHVDADSAPHRADIACGGPAFGFWDEVDAVLLYAKHRIAG